MGSQRCARQTEGGNQMTRKELEEFASGIAYWWHTDWEWESQLDYVVKINNAAKNNNACMAEQWEAIVRGLA